MNIEGKIGKIVIDNGLVKVVELDFPHNVIFEEEPCPNCFIPSAYFEPHIPETVYICTVCGSRSDTRKCEHCAECISCGEKPTGSIGVDVYCDECFSHVSEIQGDPYVHVDDICTI